LVPPEGFFIFQNPRRTELDPFFCQDVQLAVALSLRLALFSPLAHKAADEKVRGNYAVAWDEWREWIVSQGATDWQFLQLAGVLSRRLIPERGDPPTARHTSLYVVTFPAGIVSVKS
jgi:hypothetical protein